MSDIVTRLRNWSIVPSSSPASDLMEEAADEMERLRNGTLESRETVQCPYVVGKTTLHCSLTPLTLTDAEREGVERLIEDYEQDGEPASANCVATLRGLLSRMGGER